MNRNTGYGRIEDGNINVQRILNFMIDSLFNGSSPDKKIMLPKSELFDCLGHNCYFCIIQYHILWVLILIDFWFYCVN